MSEHKKQFEAIVAVYGIADRNGNVFTEQAALKLFDTIRRQAELQEEISGMPGYRVVSARMEGDRQQGKVFATFQALADDIPTWSSLGMSVSDEAFPDQEITDEELCKMIGGPCQVYLSHLEKWMDMLLIEVRTSPTRDPDLEFVLVTPAPTFPGQGIAFHSSGYKVEGPCPPLRDYMAAKLTREQWSKHLRRKPEQNLQLSPGNV